MIFRYSIRRGRFVACWLPLVLGVHAAEALLEGAAATGRDLPLWVSDTGVLSEGDAVASTAEADTLKLQDLTAQAERRQQTLALLALDEGVDRADSAELLLARPETDADTSSDEKVQTGMFADTHVQAEIAKATKVANFLANDAKELSKQLQLIRGPLLRRLTGGDKKPRQAPGYEQEARPETEVRPAPEALGKAGGAGEEGGADEALEAGGDGGGDRSYVHEDAGRVEPVSRRVKEQSVALMATRPRLPDPEDSLQLTDDDKEGGEDFEDVDAAPGASLFGKGKQLHGRAGKGKRGPKGRKKDRTALPAGLPVDDFEPFGVDGKPAGEVAPMSAASASARQAAREEEEEEVPAAGEPEEEGLVEPRKAHRRADEQVLEPDGGDGDGDNQGHHHGHHGGDGGHHHQAEGVEHKKTGTSAAMQAIHVVILVLVISFLILWVYHVRRRLNEAAAAKAAEEEKRKKDEEEGKVDPAAADGEKEGGEEGEKKGKFSGFLKK